MAALLTLRPRSLARVEYAVDGSDRIVEVGGDWDEFARANGLVRSYVGTPLWDAVHGADVQAVWRLLLQRVRTTGVGLAFPYRCDAPQLERPMRMELHPRRDDGVLFRSTVVEQRGRPPLRLLDRTALREGEPVTACAWCARMRLGLWVEPDVAVDMLDLLDAGAPVPPLSHGICPACTRAMTALFA